MGLGSPKSEIGYLAVFIFIIIGFSSGESGYFIAAVIWFLITVIFSDNEK